MMPAVRRCLARKPTPTAARSTRFANWSAEDWARSLPVAAALARRPGVASGGTAPEPGASAMPDRTRGPNVRRMRRLSPGIEEIRTFLKDSGWFDAPPVERRALTLEATAAVVAPPGTTAVPAVLGGRPAEWLLPGAVSRDKVVLYL